MKPALPRRHIQTPIGLLPVFTLEEIKREAQRAAAGK
jgi:hypothetical protein